MGDIPQKARETARAICLHSRLLVLGPIGLALLTFAGCGGSNAKPSSTPAPSPPAAFLDFAAQIDQALTLGDTDLITGRTKFIGWICPNNYFPAPGPNCTKSAQGGGVNAIDIGLYASEGDIYDEPSYGRYLANWIYDALRDSSDDFGSGAPRVYATADMSEEVEGYQGELGTYEVVATRVARSPTSGTPRRDVLTFFVAGTREGWLITNLLRSPVDFLVPESREAASIFTSWQRWTRPAPTGELADRWKAGRGGRELAYLDSSGTLYVASADGSLTKTIAQGVCGGTTTGKNEVRWSADARRVAVQCAGSERGKSDIEIYRSDGTGPQGVVQGVSTYAWSPNGHRIAYQTLSMPGGVLTPAVRVRDVDSGEDSLVHDRAVLLGWPRLDEMLLGLNPASVSGAYFETYEAYFYNFATGAFSRVQRFDDQHQFWLAPSVNKAIVLGPQIPQKDGLGLQLAVYDITSGEETPLAGLAIAYGSSSIPPGNVVVSPLGDRFIWADYTTEVAVSQSALDGSHATLLDRLKGAEITYLSPDGLVLYSTGPDGPPGLTIRDLLTGAETNWPEAVVGAVAPFAGQS